GRLAHNAETLKVFSRRIAETGQFLLDVMSKDAFATPTSRGFVAIQKVRLIHASIREFVSHGGWNTDQHGVPVSQLHLAGTLMTFSIALIDGLRQFGIEADAEREMAYLHRWQVIGALLGITDDGLPADVPSARTLLNTFIAREAHENEPGKRLAAALVDFGKQAIPKERFDAAPELLIQYLAGTEIASMTGVTPVPGCLARILPQAVLRLFGLIEQLEDKHTVVQTVLDKASLLIMRHMVQYFREEKGVQFRIEGFAPGAFLHDGD
ncbi:MAG: oxygenase MpaB family protein, partial [Saprospiraceae bacterium]|nr:oxygenase MpaB family protein [Saprospiraceae bacterium]